MRIYSVTCPYDFTVTYCVSHLVHGASGSSQEEVPLQGVNLIPGLHDFPAQHEREDQLVLLKQTPTQKTKSYWYTTTTTKGVQLKPVLLKQTPTTILVL